MGAAVKGVVNPVLSGADILAIDDRSDLKKVYVPEWKTDVYLRVLSGVERDRFELALNDGLTGKAKPNVRAFLAVMCLCDESGKRLFKDSDAEALGEKNAVALDRVFSVAKELNVLDDEDVERIEKN